MFAGGLIIMTRDARTVVDDAAKPDGLSGDDDRLCDDAARHRCHGGDVRSGATDHPVDNRLIIGFGFSLTALSMWQMSQFSLQMGMAPVIISGLLQGFGLGCTQVLLNILALSTLPRHILTQGTPIRSLMRNLGGSIGISVLVANLKWRKPRSCDTSLRGCGRTTRWRGLHTRRRTACQRAKRHRGA